VNLVQKVARWALSKAVGFPVYNTTNFPVSMFYGLQGSAEQLAVVYGCCRVRGQTLGSVPFHVYREKKSGSRVKDTEHPLYPILHDSPNARLTSMEFRERMERSFCLWGNAYAEIKRSNKRVTSLQFLRPESMQVRIDPQKGLIYDYAYQGRMDTYRAEEILHIKNMGSFDFYGESPLLRYVMEHALSAQSFGLNFLKNGGRPGGYLKNKGKRPSNEVVVDKMKADWKAQYGGPENAGQTAVTWEDAEYIPISVPPDEAQLLETAKRLTNDIAGAIYGVPGNMIGQPSETSTYASAEQFALDFVKHTIRPQCFRYEQAFNKALFAAEAGVSCEFDLDGLLRGDSASQANYYASALQNGWMNRNEVRSKQNLPPIDGGDEFTVQTNLGILSQIADAIANPKPQPTGAAQ
jgi:HK97 family phage portal protein